MKSLFDLSFTRFVTPSLIKIIYVLLMVFLGIGYLALVVASFSESVGFGLLMLVIIGPIFVLVYLALARAGLESLVAQIRTAENTAELVRLAGGQVGGQPTSGPYPGPNPGPAAGPAAPQNPYQS